MVRLYLKAGPSPAGFSAFAGVSGGRILDAVIGADPLGKYASALTACAAALAAAVVFAPVAGYGTVRVDDARYVVLRTPPGTAPLDAVAAWFSSPLGLQVPLTLASLDLDRLLWASDPVSGHHRTNLLLHCLNAALVCLLLRALGVSAPTALAGSLFFAWHPAQVEPVAWISERKSLLCAAFALAGFNLMVRGRGRWAGPLCLAAAILSKVTAVVLVPLSALLTHCGIGDRTASRNVRMTFALLVVPATLIGALTLARFPVSLERWASDGAMESGCRAVSMLGYYARLALWPQEPRIYEFEESALYGRPEWILLHAALAALVTSLAVIGCLRRRAWGYWAAWFVLLVLPAALIGAPIGTRHLYLPLVAVPAGLALAPGPLRRWAAPIVLASAILGLPLTMRALPDWKDGTSHAKAALRYHPEDKRALWLLADDHLLTGRTEEAIRIYRRLIHNYPADPDAYEALMRIGIERGRRAQVVHLAGKFESAAPGHPAAHRLRAMIDHASGNLVRAEARLRLAVEEGSRDALTHLNLISMRLALGRIAEAAEALEHLSRLHPRLPELPVLRARIAAASGDWRKAEEQLRGAIRSGASGVPLYRLLAETLRRRGDLAGAARAERQASMLGSGRTAVPARTTETRP
ncbi:MAG: Beta-barrel assembly-enhancing protease [Candidatus Omnitrophica bacterium]|nr:Beta-barrel assembly-enhancing protease [Candidatus Omnitrophota bacterium]